MWYFGPIPLSCLRMAYDSAVSCFRTKHLDDMSFLYDPVQFPPPHQKNSTWFSSSKQKISLLKVNKSSTGGEYKHVLKFWRQERHHTQPSKYEEVNSSTSLFSLDLKSSRADCPLLSVLLVSCTPD